MALRRIQPGERFHLSDFIRLFLSNAVSDLEHARREGELRRSLWEIVWFRWMQFWGTYRGFALSGPLTRDLQRTFSYPLDHPGTSDSPARDERPIDYRGAGHLGGGRGPRKRDRR